MEDVDAAGTNTRNKERRRGRIREENARGGTTRKDKG